VFIVIGEREEARIPRLSATARTKSPDIAPGRRLCHVPSEAQLLQENALLLAETHRANIMRKLQVDTVSELVRYALRNLIFEP